MLILYPDRGVETRIPRVPQMLSLPDPFFQDFDLLGRAREGLGGFGRCLQVARPCESTTCVTIARRIEGANRQVFVTQHAKTARPMRIVLLTMTAPFAYRSGYSVWFVEDDVIVRF